jgi:hypothetical protein
MKESSNMKTLRTLKSHGLALGCAALAGLLVPEALAESPDAYRKHPGAITRMTMNAGTTFTAPDANGRHEVRGVVQVSNLGNCKVFFEVNISPGTAGEHLFNAVGEMTITTLAGDKLQADVLGWADPDPNDLKPTGPTTFKLHYDVRIKGGTGKLAGALGKGRIDGVFVFPGPDSPEDMDPTDDRFCDGYGGVATWLYRGVLILPGEK